MNKVGAGRKRLKNIAITFFFLKNSPPALRGQGLRTEKRPLILDILPPKDDGIPEQVLLPMSPNACSFIFFRILRSEMALAHSFFCFCPVGPWDLTLFRTGEGPLEVGPLNPGAKFHNKY